MRLRRIFSFQLTAEKFLFMFLARFHVAFIARQTGVADFVKPFRVAVNGDFPFKKCCTAERKQNHRIHIRNQNQKAVLKETVPIIKQTRIEPGTPETEYFTHLVMLSALPYVTFRAFLTQYRWKLIA